MEAYNELRLQEKVEAALAVAKKVLDLDKYRYFPPPTSFYLPPPPATSFRLLYPSAANSFLTQRLLLSYFSFSLCSEVFFFLSFSFSSFFLYSLLLSPSPPLLPSPLIIPSFLSPLSLLAFSSPPRRHGSIGRAQDMPHRYEDKYVLVESMTNACINAIIDSLFAIGLTPEDLKKMMVWNEKRSVTLCFEVLFLPIPLPPTSSHLFTEY